MDWIGQGHWHKGRLNKWNGKARLRGMANWNGIRWPGHKRRNRRERQKRTTGLMAVHVQYTMDRTAPNVCIYVHCKYISLSKYFMVYVNEP